MENKAIPRPFSVLILAILLLLIGVGSLISGPLLFLSPSGHLLQLPIELLKGTPFANYFLPGIILLMFVGVYPIFVGYSLLKRPPWRWPDVINPSKRFHWAWTASWAAGVILLIWIITEILLLGYISFLQPLVIVWGIILIALTLLPNVRRYYRRDAKTD